MSDIEEMDALAQIAEARPQVEPEDEAQDLVDFDPAAAPALQLADPATSDMEDMEALAEIAEARPQRKFKRNSWELALHASLSKQLKKSQAETAQSGAARDALGGVLACMQQVGLPLCAIPGVKTRSYATNRMRASMASYYAFSHAIKAATASRNLQTAAVSVVARCALEMQKDWLRQVVQATGEQPSAMAVHAGMGGWRPPCTVQVFSWQWDETSQRLRGHMEYRSRAEKLGHRQVAVHIMMQSGACMSFRIGDRSCELQQESRWFARGLALREQDANFLLEGLARGMPFSFDGQPSLSEIAGATCPVVL